MDNNSDPPEFSSAAVNDATLEVTFDENLDTSAVPATSAFTVTVGTNARGVSSVAILDEVVTLTLDSAVIEGEDVKVRYTKPATGSKLRSASDSLEVAPFSDQTVTNNTDSTAPTFLSAAVDGTDLKVTFDDELDSSSTPAASAFTVTVGTSARGVNSVVISDEVVTLTLVSEVTNNDDVKVSYTNPGSANNPLRDNASTPNEVDTFVDKEVTNNTGDVFPPVFSSAAVNEAELTITFNENLDSSVTPAASAFTVTVGTSGRGVASVDVLSDVVTLTLDSAVIEGEDVKVRYDKPATGDKLQDTSGNEVDSFVDQTVTNNTEDLVAPVFSSAAVFLAELTVTFDEALNPGSVPAASAFTVTVGTSGRGVASVDVLNDVVTLTLTSAVTAGDSVRIEYTPPANNPLEDAFDNPVANFGPVLATNSTPTTPPVQPPVPSFGGAAVAALNLDRGRAMAPVVLPQATGGDGALTYSLTSAPAGLAGLDFDPATRRLSGTPGSLGSWTFTYRAEDADADRTDSDAAVLTFGVTVAAPATDQTVAAVKRTLARVAARTLSSALGHIGLRLTNVVPSAGLMLSGRRLEFAAPGMGLGVEGAGGACAWGGLDPHGFGRHGLDWQGFDRHGVGDAWRDGLGSGGGCEGWSRGIGTEELLRASAFSWLLGAAEGSGGADPAAARWAVWGRGDFSDFAGRPEGMSYDGKARSGWLGVDARKDRWVAGLALSHGVSEADYSYGGGAERGRLETTLTALYPYGRWTLAEGLEVRGVLGAGSGEARHMPEDAEAATSDLTMRMGSAGVRRELAEVLGIELAARADASLVRMEIEAGPEFIDGVSADSWRARLGLEATRRLALGEETALTPFMEVTGRRDGGDGLEGSGLEVAGGVRYTAPRVEVEARGRLLAAHAEEGARERGVSVTARLGPGADGRGLSLSLRPRWGAGTGGAEALWRDELPGLSGAGDGAALDARIGYGVAVAPAGGLLTPFVEAGMSESRRLRVGTRFDGRRADLGLELSGERRESGNGGAEHGVLFDLRLRF